MGEKRVGNFRARLALRYKIVGLAQFQRASRYAMRVCCNEMNAIVIQPIQHNFRGVLTEAAKQRLRASLARNNLAATSAKVFQADDGGLVRCAPDAWK